MLAHLTQQTRQHHGRADGDRLAIMEKPTIERYRAFLGQIYCFEASVEAALIATEGLDRGLLRTHLKANKLSADLDALGLVPGEVPSTATLHFNCPGEALGWMWVVHRNTLLHGLVYRYLQDKLQDTMQTAGGYLAAFEGRAGALMRQLGDALDAAAKRSPVASKIAIAANDAFRMQRQWYGCDVLTPRRLLVTRTTAPKRAA